MISQRGSMIEELTKELEDRKSNDIITEYGSGIEYEIIQ